MPALHFQSKDSQTHLAKKAHYKKRPPKNDYAPSPHPSFSSPNISSLYPLAWNYVKVINKAKPGRIGGLGRTALQTEAISTL